MAIINNAKAVVETIAMTATVQSLNGVKKDRRTQSRPKLQTCH